MPSNCNVTTHSTLTVTYADGTTETSTASPDFAPTGCASLPFNPQVTGSLVKDAHDNGVAVVTNQTSGARRVRRPVDHPRAPVAGDHREHRLAPAAELDHPDRDRRRDEPAAAGAADGVRLPHRPEPILTDADAEVPAAGSADAGRHRRPRRPHGHVPDTAGRPQTGLTVTLFGGPKAAEAATCAPPGGILRASNTGQNGKVVSVAFPISVAGCPTVPKLSGLSLGGLASGKPALRFKVTRGTDAPNLRSITVTLPRGLTLNKSKRLGKGISVSGGHAVNGAGGQLTITLRPAPASVTVSISPAALIESKQLRQQVKMHKDNPTAQLRFRILDADGSASTLNG